jgi:hypothetical protein
MTGPLLSQGYWQDEEKTRRGVCPSVRKELHY